MGLERAHNEWTPSLGQGWAVKKLTYPSSSHWGISRPQTGHLRVGPSWPAFPEALRLTTTQAWPWTLCVHPLGSSPEVGPAAFPQVPSSPSTVQDHPLSPRTTGLAGVLAAAPGHLTTLMQLTACLLESLSQESLFPEMCLTYHCSHLHLTPSSVIAPGWTTGPYVPATQRKQL